MNKIKEIQKQIVKDFALFEGEPMGQYEYIIDLGKELPPLSEQHKTEANIVKGCQSTVWLHAFKQAGKIRFQADSNTVITKGIIALLVKVLDNQSPTDIINADLTFIEEINLRSHLSSQRSNGLTAMLNQMKLYAITFESKSNGIKVDGGAITKESNEAKDNQNTGIKTNTQKTLKSPAQIEMMVTEKLKEVFDPEIPVNIYELGLIYEVQVYPPLNNVFIKMTVTAPNCPVADSLPIEARDKVKELPEVGEVDVELTFDPPWDKEMMSEEAKLELGFF